jgi:hypothetical protein
MRACMIWLLQSYDTSFIKWYHFVIWYDIYHMIFWYLLNISIWYQSDYWYCITVTNSPGFTSRTSSTSKRTLNADLRVEMHKEVCSSQWMQRMWVLQCYQLQLQLQFLRIKKHSPCA